MKKSLCTLLALLMIFASTAVFAAKDVETQLNLPLTYNQKAGDGYGMELNVVLPDNYKNDLKTFSMSFRVDKTIHIDKAIFVGDLADNDYRLMSTKTDSSKQEIVTLVIPDIKALNRPNFTLKLSGKFKKGVKNVNHVSMSYVIALVDNKGKNRSIQKNVTSDKGQAIPAVPSGQTPGTAPSGYKFTVDPIKPGDNTLTGKAVSNAGVRVYRGKTLIGTTVAEKDGRFAVVINPQPEGSELTFIFKTKAGEDEVRAVVKKNPTTNSSSATAQNKTKIDDYLRVLSSVNMSGREKLAQLQVNAAVATGQFILAKDNADGTEIAGAENTLAEAMKVARPAYFSGYPNGKFLPKKAMTRAEVSAVFARVASGKKELAGFTSFKDVDDSQWFAASVGYMEKRGLISGYKDGTFKPHQSITRAEFARILAAYANLTPTAGTSFTDVKSNHWAKGYIGAVQEAGLMSGKGKGRFAPSAKITRQEVCTALNKALSRTPDKAFLDTYGSNPFKDVNKKMWSYYDILEATGQPQ
ncbi:S-layer homology domain-containing protein [Aedoeadaptatus urinae]|uniref:S-layer homology domain-containing protein n=1 Tax=Aedoeadaptatus urinae TaxID=1871017 RepID=UPI00097CFD3D|nr:S-layer homology domain-containing protein [Peptoniphilus urinae]